jgi:hypothetical protein
MKNDKEKTIFLKTYHGFEAASDIERDVLECLESSDLPGEFQGKLKVTITYEND